MASTSLIILIDNTAHSIDADFPPNRFEAQKNCVEQLADHYSRKGPNAEVGVGTISSIYGGMQVSLTIRQELIRITKGLAHVQCGGKARLINSIKRAVLALNCCAPENKLDRRIIAFIGSPHDITNENAIELSDYLHRVGVSITFISFGDFVNNEPLQLLIDNLQDEKSKLIKIGSDSPTLYNAVYTSLIKSEDNQDMIPQDDDPELAQALRMSLEGQPGHEDDPELAAAIQASLADYGNNETNEIEEDDPELAAAIAMSLKENAPPPAEDHAQEEPHQEESQETPSQEETKAAESGDSSKKTDPSSQPQK